MFQLKVMNDCDISKYCCSLPARISTLTYSNSLFVFIIYLRRWHHESPMELLWRNWVQLQTALWLSTVMWRTRLSRSNLRYSLVAHKLTCLKPLHCNLVWSVGKVPRAFRWVLHSRAGHGGHRGRHRCAPAPHTLLQHVRGFLLARVRPDPHVWHLEPQHQVLRQPLRRLYRRGWPIPGILESINLLKSRNNYYECLMTHNYNLFLTRTLICSFCLNREATFMYYIDLKIISYKICIQILST